MLLLDLADAVRAGGLTVHELSGWRDHHHGEMAGVSGVVCHHTGSSSAGAEGVVRNGRSDLRGPLAQLTLRRDGSVGVISAGVSWHAGTGSWPSIGRNNGNARLIGIEAVYNGSDITPEQVAAYPRLVAALARRYRFPIGNVIGHREWAPGRKSDPGKIDMPSLRATVAAQLGGQPPAPIPAPGAPVPANGYAGPYRKGSRDANAPRPGGPVWRIQERLRTAYRGYAGHIAADGIFGDQTGDAVGEFQRRSRLDDDEVVGPATWSALKL